MVDQHRQDAERAVNAFERAVLDVAFEGTIPVYSDDPEEQAALDAEHRRIKANYTRTRLRLILLARGN